MGLSEYGLVKTLVDLLRISEDDVPAEIVGRLIVMLTLLTLLTVQ